MPVEKFIDPAFLEAKLSEIIAWLQANILVLSTAIQLTVVVIAFVIEGTAADVAGLLSEDVILELGEEAIRNTGELSKFLIAHGPGETVDVLVVRQGRELSGQITLRERPE